MTENKTNQSLNAGENDPEQMQLTQRINELAAKAKQPKGLTEAEKAEQAKLRQAFLANFRKNFRSQVEMLQVYDKAGNEVTPDKVKKIQREKGLRED